MPNGLYPRRNMIKSRNEFLALLKEEAYKKGDFKYHLEERVSTMLTVSQ